MRLYAKHAKRKYQWAAKRITEDQMDRLMKMREDTGVPVSLLVANAIEDFLCNSRKDDIRRWASTNLSDLESTKEKRSGRLLSLI